MLNKAEEVGIFKGISVESNGFSISHLQYVDDLIIFLDNDEASVKGIKSVLQSFQVLTGLKINFHKSKLFGFHEDKETLIHWAFLLNCEAGNEPITYLGANISTSSNQVQFRDSLLQKIRKKLAPWKGKNINMAGRTILIKAALDSLPIYWLNLFKLPNTVVHRIDRCRRDFLWGSYSGEQQHAHKLHLLGWERICKPKAKGGLGLPSIHLRNSALLLKWWWRCSSERDNLWNQFLKAKYGVNIWLGLQRLDSS